MLQKEFFDSLKTWIHELNKVAFFVEEKKPEVITRLLCTLIFIQLLANAGVLPPSCIVSQWVRSRKKSQKNALEMLEDFLKELNEWYSAFCCTEFSRERQDILDCIKKDRKNVALLYRNIQSVLGIHYEGRADIKGIIQYNFREMDEDILGKAYETMLAELRKEEGIYYTPKYIVHYIVECTVGALYEELLGEIENALEKKDFQEGRKALKRALSVKVLDPACGSGFFLAEAVKIIWRNYCELRQLFEREKKSVHGHVLPEKRLKMLESIDGLQEMVGFKNERSAISTIVLRHIYGIDKDEIALEIAQATIWLEAMKLAPSEFKNKFQCNELPDLRMNLSHGNFLIGLPMNKTIGLLKENPRDLKRLHALRTAYIQNPNQSIIGEITRRKKQLRKVLDEEFIQYLEENDLPLDMEPTSPLHWGLDFWHIFFDEAASFKSDGGFDVIVGNPPYYSIRNIHHTPAESNILYEYLKTSEEWKPFFRSATDVYYYFIIRSISVMVPHAILGFIVESYWLENTWADKLREVILKKTHILELLHFGSAKIFEDAGNDTCILILRKDEPARTKTRVILCQNSRKKYFHPSELIDQIIHHKNEEYSDECITTFWKEQIAFGAGKWILSPEDEIIGKLRKDGERIVPLADLDEAIKRKFPDEFVALNGKELIGVCYVGVGSQPGDKAVFRVTVKECENGLALCTNTSLGIDHMIEEALLQNLITNSQIEQFFIEGRNEYIIYPVIDDIEKYPHYKAYTEIPSIKKRLEDRHEFRKGKCRRFDFSVYRNRVLFESNEQKIYTPYRAGKNTFAATDTMYIGTTDIYVIVPKGEIDVKYLLGLLNSSLLTFWYREAGKRKGSMLEYFTEPLSRIPIRNASCAEQAPIIHLVEEIMVYKRAQHECGRFLKLTAEKSSERLQEQNLEIKEDIGEINACIREIEATIDAHVFRLYGFTEKEARMVLESLSVLEDTKTLVAKKIVELLQTDTDKNGKNEFLNDS